jgi:hypothetical protein
LVLCGGAIFHGPLEKASLADFDLIYRSSVRLLHGRMLMSVTSAARGKRSEWITISATAFQLQPEPPARDAQPQSFERC